MKFNGFELLWLEPEHAELIPSAYISVFTDHPWHEEFECSCGAGPYSTGCNRTENKNKKCEEFEKKLFLINDYERCVECDSPLSESLKPVFTPEGVIDDFLGTIKKPGFVGLGAVNKGRLIGFAWGYDFPLNHPSKEGSTWYNEAIPLIESCGVDPASCLYHNESGTLYDFRGRGIGTILLQKMLQKNSINKSHVVYRTINPAMTRCYEKAANFSKGELLPSFNDPNPKKRQDWFLINLLEIR